METLKQVSEKAFHFLNRNEKQSSCLNCIGNPFPDIDFEDKAVVDNFLENDIFPRLDKMLQQPNPTLRKKTLILLRGYCTLDDSVIPYSTIIKCGLINRILPFF